MEAQDSAFLGVVGSLLRKINELQRTEDGARQLIDDLRSIRTKMEKLSQVLDLPHTASYWMKHAREEFYDMEDDLDDQPSVPASGPDRVNQLISGFKARIDELQEIYIRRYNNFEYVFGQTTNTLPGDRLPDGRELHPVVPDGIHCPPYEFLQWLKPNKDDRDKQLMVLSIHGVEGVGKSTLAQKLWHDLKGYYFECRAFIQTAKKPDMRMILTNILSQVRLERPPKNFQVPNLIEDIKNHLQDKRYLIVIDDLWTVSVWDVLRHAFPYCNCSSRIIITTTTENIALACCSYDPKYIFRMKPLSEDHSKKLFIGTAFGRDRCPPQLNDSLDKITRKCGGLPLALTCLATLMSRLKGTAMEKQEYFKFLSNNLRTNSTAMEVLNQVLRLCYNSLTHSLKTCLLHLTVYPMSYPIQKEDLVKQWIAEGFVAFDGKDIEAVARSYFDELFNLNLIQQMDISNCDKKRVSYRVHPVLYSCLTCTSTNENFITIIDYTQNTVVLTDKIRRLALHFGSATYATPPANTGLSQVRSFSYMGPMSCMPSLGKFKLVRVIILHFQYDHGEVSNEKDDHSFSLTEISKLFLLRYLQVRCSITVVLPHKVQCLEHLETLEVNAEVADVPSDIVSHQSLKHVRLGRKMKHNHLILGPDTSGREAVFSNASSRESSESLQKLELLPPICSFSRLPQWVGQLKELRVLEIVVRELGMYEPEFLILSGLRFLTALSLHVRKPNASRVFNFPGAALPVLKYLKLVCGVLLLSFQKEAVCNLEKLKIGFNIHSEVDYGKMLSGIDNLLKLQVIVASIGAVEESGRAAAASALRDTISKHPRNPSLKVKRVEPFYEEQDPLQICSPTDQKNGSEIQEEESSIEQPEVLQKLPTLDNTHNPASVPPDIEGLAAGPSSGAAYQGPQIKIGIRSGPTDEVEIELARLNAFIMTGSLQAKLQGLLELDHALPSNARKDISFIYQNLEFMRHFIRIYSVFYPRVYMESLSKGWLNYFRELAFDIENFVDLWTICNDTAASSSENEELLTRIRRNFKNFSRSDEILTNLRDIKMRVAKQWERLRRGNILAVPSRDPFIGRSHHQSGIFVPYKTSEELVGMAGPMEEVSKMVFKAGETAERKIIFIVGMAGSGKTTLAAEVYRELVSQGYFQRSAFISAGRKPEMDSESLKDMLLQFNNKHHGHDSDEYDDKNFHEFIERVRELLMNSRYLIVIDDLRSMLLWGILLDCIEEDNLGSRIIITTRKPELAKQSFGIRRYCVYKMDLLSDSDSKSLFLKIVFGNEQGCPNHLEAISAQIIKRCGGLPLALISIASSLKSCPPTQEEWERHRLNFLSSSDGKYMMQKLSSSYDDLPSSFKTCMLYLAIFPEQYEVEIERLMRLWIAEGFIIREKARIIVEELISISIVLPLHVKHNGIPRYFRVHPVMHNSIVYKSIEENLVTLVDAQCQDAPANNGTIRRLSHQSSSNGDQEGSQIASADLSHARTIIVFGQASAVPPLTNLRLVRVLDLDGCHGPVCLDGLHNLLLLRYLSLRGTDVSELPDNIGELRCLETLDVRSTNVIELPASIVRLEKLKHLLAGSAKLPQGISKMEALQTLSGTIVTNAYAKMVEELSELADLRELDLSCDLTEVPGDGKHFEFPVHGFQSLRLLCIQGTLPSVTFGRSVLPKVETLELKFKRCISGDILGIENLQSLTHVLLEFPQHDASAMAIVDTVREAASQNHPDQPEVIVIVDGRTRDPLPPKETEFRPLH